MASSIWDLFAEDEQIGVYQEREEEGPAGTGATATSTRKLAKPSPPPPRNSTQLCGLSNLGATCYLNSLVQTLFYSPGFRRGLFLLGRLIVTCLHATQCLPYLRAHHHLLMACVAPSDLLVQYHPLMVCVAPSDLLVQYHPTLATITTHTHTHTHFIGHHLKWACPFICPVCHHHRYTRQTHYTNPTNLTNRSENPNNPSSNPIN